MRGFLSTLICLPVVALALPAQAQTATRIGQHNDWAAYSYVQNNAKTCYVLSVPKAKQPADLNHGDIFFFVQHKPGQNVSFEPQFTAGYNLRENSSVTVTVGNASFTMFTRGNSAWIENPAQEPQLIAAMRGGATMSIKATSGRGNATSYEFSLKGISAALNSIGTCR